VERADTEAAEEAQAAWAAERAAERAEKRAASLVKSSSARKAWQDLHVRPRTASGTTLVRRCFFFAPNNKHTTCCGIGPDAYRPGSHCRCP
jgi:hypothetical protein